MSREYSEAEVRKMLEAAVSLVRADDSLSHSRGNEFANLDLAEEILRNPLPHYKQTMPQEFLDVVNTSKIEKMCNDAIRQVRGPKSYVLK